MKVASDKHISQGVRRQCLRVVEPCCSKLVNPDLISREIVLGEIHVRVSEIGTGEAARSLSQDVRVARGIDSHVIGRVKAERAEAKKEPLKADDDDEWGAVPAFLRRSRLK